MREEKNMVHSPPRVRLKIEDPANYRIRVQGCLEDVWSDRLANMTITMDLRDKEAPISTLVGRVRDQAELFGVLNGLYELRMPLLEMEIIDDG
jgi:hypothetical protein